MAVATFTRVEIFDERMYHGNGLVISWTRKITSRFAREARRYAPIRSGELKAGIRASTRNRGPKMVSGMIGSTAPHTMYVLRGTAVRGTGRIYSRVGWEMRTHGRIGLGNGYYWTPARGRANLVWPTPSPVKGLMLAVGKQRLYPPTLRRLSVSGQKPNNFMERAWRATARDHRAIRGMPFPLSFD